MRKFMNMYVFSMRVLISIAVACFLVSCKQNKAASDGENNIQVETLKVDTVVVDTMENCSYVGYSGVYGDSLFFFDEVLDYFYAVSSDGKVGKRRLGLGHSSREIPITRPVGVSYSNQSKQLAVMGGTYDLYTTSKFDDVRKVQMVVGNAEDGYSSASSYTLWEEVVQRNDKDYLYYNVLGDNEKVDILHGKDYFEKAAIIMRVNLANGEMRPMGHYSEFYAKNPKVRHLPSVYYDVDDNGDFYVSFQADSLIYQYDKDFKLIGSFGFQGKDMNTHYTDPGTTDEQYAKAYMEDNQNTGYYYWIEQIEDYTFRSYQKWLIVPSINRWFMSATI